MKITKRQKGGSNMNGKRVMSLVMMLMLVLFWCGVTPAVAADAKTLRLITFPGYAPPELIKKFQQETGITVQVTDSSNEDMIAKLRATRGGGFDLAQPSQDRIVAVTQQFGLYQPIDLKKVNTNQIDPVLMDSVKKNASTGGKLYAVPHVFGSSGLIINKKMAPDAKDWTDFLNPKYKDRVSYRMKRPVLCAVAFGLGENPFAKYNDKQAYQKLLDKVSAELIKAKPIVRNYWENGDALVQSIRSGEVWIAEGWEQAGWKLYEENKDIDWVGPASGAMAWIDTFAIPSKSENVEGAYKWINFSLKPENAAIFTNKEKYATASKDAVKYIDENIKANFTRCYTPEVMKKMNWYPTVPAGLEEMEGKVMDKIKAAK
jgi:spermidine/putrescine transport system substrate-binding protein